MGFQKGRAKTGGRKPGVKNKTTQEIRDKIQLVLSNKIEELEADLEQMSEFKQWTILNAVAKYVMPQLSKSDDTVEHSGEINITVSFTDSQIDKPNDDAGLDIEEPF
ncbi:hypothetical protein [Mucilaginibacter defluvii]|uniref:Uncharacterized protein n=1 Tax=Mucilaginibacter defluvii TaxID=1196019 RepID=A0ABP9FLS5_9SPHI